MRVNISQLIPIVEEAGRRILSIYQQPQFEIMNKLDNSVLTEADLLSHQFICDALMQLYPSIPILSEESTEQYSYAERKNWDRFFLVDPLDGTKEFIQRNGEFTVNVALIENNQPVLGIIHAPVLNVTYHAEKNKGAYKIIKGEENKLFPQSTESKHLRVVISRSHYSAETAALLAKLNTEGKTITTLSAGSALKFGLIAEGNADIYPRLAPTMEWDTAAGQILVNEVGKKVLQANSDQQLEYNKVSLINPGFIVQ